MDEDNTESRVIPGGDFDGEWKKRNFLRHLGAVLHRQSKTWIIGPGTMNAEANFKKIPGMSTPTKKKKKKKRPVAPKTQAKAPASRSKRARTQ